MPRRSLAQASFFDPEFACPAALEPGTVPWLLARHRSTLFPPWLLEGWRGGGRGRNAWPAVVLLTLVFLRWTETGMSRRASVRRARTDVAWRAAMGLSLDVKPPDEKTLRDFERWLRARHPQTGVPRFLLLHEHLLRHCAAVLNIGDDALWATDSTPMWCYGAVLDTVRLLGDGLRQLGRRWAQATRSTLKEVAAEWELPLLLAKSTKGGLAINWRNADERNGAISGLAETVLRVVSRVRDQAASVRRSLRKPLLRLCRRLLRVVRDDLETDEEGRLVIARRVARDRLISLTDPQARHGHKSRSKTFNGFKLHVLGDVVSGLIACVSVTAGNQHDNSVAHRLIGRAKKLFADLERVLGDTAYGGVDLRLSVRNTLGVNILAPPQPVTRSTDRFDKADFEVDGDVVTCPAGVATTRYTSPPSLKGRKRYVWDRKDCGPCAFAERCLLGKYRHRVLVLHEHEDELRAIRKQWDLPETRAAYRDRTQCERLVHLMTRRGARKARAWGLGYAHFQAHVIATTSNLSLLAKALADAGDPEVRAAA